MEERKPPYSGMTRVRTPSFGHPLRLRMEEGTRLVLRRFSGPEDAPHLLILHGFWRSGLSPRMRRLADRCRNRFRVWIPDLRGHGGSEGLFQFGRKEVADVAAVLRYLGGIDGAPIIVIGFSMGGHFAVNAVGRYRQDMPEVRGIAAVSCPVEPGRLRVPWWDMRILRGIRLGEIWRVPRFVPPQLVRGRPDPLRALENLGATSLLVVHSHRDWLIPEEDARAYYEHAGGPRRLVVLDNDCRSHADALLRFSPEKIHGVLDPWLEEIAEPRAGSSGVEG